MPAIVGRRLRLPFRSWLVSDEAFAFRTTISDMGSRACAALFLCSLLRAVEVTPPPLGPFHIEGNRIVDARGKGFLLRGTELPEFTLTDYQGFGPFSLSAFATLRHRMNLNAVRLPLNGSAYLKSAGYRAGVRGVVRGANRFALLVVLSGDGPDELWARVAADYKDDALVFFATRAVQAVRSAGALQPVILRGPRVDDPQMIYETVPHYATGGWERIGVLAGQVPVIASGLDPEFEHAGGECEAFPHDPADASRTIEEHLHYFDAHAISWVISSLRPGRLIQDYRYYTWTKLDDGWTCGALPAWGGIAMVVLSHLWNADVHGIFAVNQTTGGFRMAPGGISTAYGPIMADREVDGGSQPWPTALGNISVWVTDSRGVARMAPLLHTGAGWAQVTFVVPEGTAAGQAEVAVVRSDGTSSAGRVEIAELAPGFWTAAHDGRGPVIGQVTQKLASGKTAKFPAWECAEGACRTVAIPLGGGMETTVRLEGTGFRHAAASAKVRVTVGDVDVPVLSFGALPGMGRDQVTVRLPDELRGRGEVDVVLTVDGAISNVVRMKCAKF